MAVKIFVDTMIFNYAAKSKLECRAITKPGTLKTKNGDIRNITVTTFNTNTRASKPINSEKLSLEINEIVTIAGMAASGQVDLVYSHEVNLELLFQPAIDIYPGRFFGAPISLTHSPLISLEAMPNTNSHSNHEPHLYIHQPSEQYYNFRSAIHQSPENAEDILRDYLLFLPVAGYGFHLDFRYLLAELRENHVLYGQLPNAAKLLFPLMQKIENAKYLAICKSLNAQSNPNTYLDAYHLWIAENAACNYFLTTENNIKKQYDNTSLLVVYPTELSSLLQMSL